jgi:hypothetical protein
MAGFVGQVSGELDLGLAILYPHDELEQQRCAAQLCLTIVTIEMNHPWID